jgi:homoserine kinase
LALDLHNRFEAQLASRWYVDVEGAGSGTLATDHTNLAAVAMARIFAETGNPELRAEIGSVNQVPTGSGLGSSSTAIVGGLLLGQALVGVDVGEQRLLEIAAEIEGHPDNVAAALHGGFTVCWSEIDGPRCARFEPARGLATVVVPAVAELATRAARAMLPDEVSHIDAAFNVAHAGLLAASIVAGRPELLGSALEDRLHQPYRLAAIEDLQTVHDILRDAGASGVALSGAGPTVIGLVAADTDELAHRRAAEVAGRAADGIRALGSRLAPQALRIDRTGARLLS